MAKAKSAEEYIEFHDPWKNELSNLRSFLKSFPFEETIKWGAPVYTYKSRNVIGIVAFKNHCALWFFDGAQLQENTALLHNAQEAKTKTLRQIRFTKDSPPADIPVLKNYVEEAMRLVDQGKISKPGVPKKVVINAEFKKFLVREPELESRFKALAPGKQREYIDYITEAKREETKEKRFEKILPLILEGKGLNDKYKK